MKPQKPHQKPHQKLHYKVQVWIWCREASGKAKVLILRTRPERGSFWQPVTGSVEKGEKIPVAALREAREETGLSFRSKPKPLGEPFCFESRGRQVEEHCFWLEATVKNLQVTLDPHEHTEYQWRTPDWAARKIKFSSNRKFLRILKKEILNDSHH
jgi:8-oxo-dGTP pyrophosphatase MutT (NUDIX family)